MFDNLIIVQDICRRLRELNPEQPPAYRDIKGVLYQEYIRANANKWQREHPEQARAGHRKYDRTERGRASKKARANRRRILEINGISFTAEQWLLRLREFDNRCVYCGSKQRKLTADHWMPLSKGGTNDINNIVPACRSCNSRKFNHNPGEFEFKGRTQMIMATVLQRQMKSG